MQFVIVGIFIAVVALLIYRSKKNMNPAEQACAKEIGDLMKTNQNADPKAIAELFKKHGVDRSRCSRVGALVMAQLQKHGLNPDDSKIIMGQVRKAYMFVQG